MKAAQGVVLATVVIAVVLLIALARTGGPKQDPAFYPYGNQVRIVGLPDQGQNELTTARVLDHDDDVQPDTLPALPSGMTVTMIVDGDALYHGLPEELTRSSIAMPPRGIHSSLNTDQVRRVAAYVWAISQTRGEPWPGGHTSHSTSSVVTIARTTGP
jgi:hypothetical protein